MKLEIEEKQSDDTHTQLLLRGEVNIHTSPQLRNLLKPLLTSERREILLDLSGVNFMDSAGIATLVEGLQWSRDYGGRFVLSGLTDNVKDIFALAKLDTVFDILEDPSQT